MTDTRLSRRLSACPGVFLALWPFAFGEDDAGPALGPARDAGIAAVQDEPVMGVLFEFIRHEFKQPFFYLINVFAGRDRGAVRDPEDMGVHRDGRLAKGGIQDHVGRLAADAGQALQRRARSRHPAVVFFQQQAATGDDVFCLVVVQADGLDVGL